MSDNFKTSDGIWMIVDEDGKEVDISQFKTFNRNDPMAHEKMWNEIFKNNPEAIGLADGTIWRKDDGTFSVVDNGKWVKMDLIIKDEE